MEAKDIITIISAVASFLFVTLIPTIIALVKKWKDAKNAKTDAEKQAIYNEMIDLAHSAIKEVEETYKNIDVILKSQTGKGSGAVKKEQVLTKLQAYCNQKNIEFDKEKWSAKIDEIVALTKQVN